MLPVRRLTEITSLIYVGGQTDQRGWSRLQRWGVGALVNVRVEWDDRRLGIRTPHYLWLPAVDGTPLSVERLAEGVAFIAEQLAAGRGVYIHCAAGLGRGPMMAAAFFVARGLHTEEAIAFVGARRPFISLSKRQRARLRDFETYLHNGGLTSSVERFTGASLPLQGGEVRG
jgi:protein-tyrosine phosphatase